MSFNATQAFGNFLQNTGTRFNLPEFNLSERFGVSGSPQAPMSVNIPRTEQVSGTQNTQTFTPGPISSNTFQSSQQFSGGQNAPIDQSGNQITPDLQTEVDARQQEVESLFSGGADLLNRLEQSTRGQEQDLITQAISPFEAQKPILAQQKEQALAGNVQAQEAEQMREANAIAAARRLFNELRQANIQRFGGATSAAPFAANILGREFQRNLGGIRNTSGQNIGNLINQAQNINQSFNAQMQKLASEIEGAKAQARQAFQARIDAINQSRFGLEQNKSVAKLDALRELRNRINNIEDTNVAFQRQLQLQQQQAAAPINDILSTFGNVAGQDVPVQTLPGAEFSTVGGGAQSTIPQSIFGFLGQGRRPEEQANALV